MFSASMPQPPPNMPQPHRDFELPHVSTDRDGRQRSKDCSDKLGEEPSSWAHYSKLGGAISKGDDRVPVKGIIENNSETKKHITFGVYSYGRWEDLDRWKWVAIDVGVFLDTPATHSENFLFRHFWDPLRFTGETHLSSTFSEPNWGSYLIFFVSPSPLTPGSPHTL